MALKIKQGMFGRTRGGEKRGPMRFRGCEEHFMWICETTGDLFTKDGTVFDYGIRSPLDLIAEWTDEPTKPATTADAILSDALTTLAQRGQEYDSPEGERSMAATVTAFAAITGVQMTETQGWLFMATLKAVRSEQGPFKADSYIDGAAYFGLAGEAASKERA